MQGIKHRSRRFIVRVTLSAWLVIVSLGLMPFASAQDTPLISGGVGFFSTTNGGQTSYLPIIEPLIAAPLGNRLLVESRGVLVESFFPKGGGQPGYDHAHAFGLTYLQGDFIASRHLTVVAGSFLTPFGTFNERLSPLWINNLQDGPLIASLGTMGTSTSVGGMVRGSAISRPNFSIAYAGYFSTRSGYTQFNSERASGGQVSLYLPKNRLELGTSYGRLLQGTHENFYGVHAWWEPQDSALRVRSEWARGKHADGYWVEGDYRMQRFGGLDSLIGRAEFVLRMQQTFRHDPTATDGLPATNTQRPDFGLDYNLPHNARILTSYSRQFSAAGNQNIWETSIVYRLLFPAWKGKRQ
jgi:hypothetical protein